MSTDFLLADYQPDLLIVSFSQLVPLVLNSGMSESLSLNSTSTVEEDQMSDRRHGETSASKKSLPTIAMDLDYVTLKAVVDSMVSLRFPFSSLPPEADTARLFPSTEKRLCSP